MGIFAWARKAFKGALTLPFGGGRGVIGRTKLWRANASLASLWSFLEDTWATKVSLFGESEASSSKTRTQPESEEELQFVALKRIQGGGKKPFNMSSIDYVHTSWVSKNFLTMDVAYFICLKHCRTVSDCSRINLSSNWRCHLEGLNVL